MPASFWAGGIAEPCAESLAAAAVEYSASGAATMAEHSPAKTVESPEETTGALVMPSTAMGDALVAAVPAEGAGCSPALSTGGVMAAVRGAVVALRPCGLAVQVWYEVQRRPDGNLCYKHVRTLRGRKQMTAHSLHLAAGF